MTWTERDWLYDLLACPDCAASLQPRSGSLFCSSGHAFPIVGGIPRFTPPSSYADSFGFEWTTFPKLQLDEGTSRESEEAFRVKTGLQPEDVRGRSVFDAGCGMGRFSHVVARWGAERVVAMDISRAVEPASLNLESFGSVALAQADLRRLPLAPASFDIVFSIGVLHHTPSTFSSLSSIAKLVKPGGILAIWVYSRRLRLRLLGGEVLRLVTSRMKGETLLGSLRRVVPRVSAVKRRLPAVAPWVDLVFPTSPHANPEWQILDTFDWYSPRYQWKHSYDEVEAWFRRLGFISVQRLGFPVSVRGRRPRKD